MDSSSSTTAKITCPICNHQILKSDVDIPQILEDQFIASMVTGKPFKRTYSLFGGRILLTVLQISNKDNTLISRACSSLPKSVLLEISPTAFLNLVYRFIAILTIKIKDNLGTLKLFVCHLKVQKALLNLCDAPASNREQKVKELLTVLVDPDVVSLLPADMLIQVIDNHQKLIRQLTLRGFDKDFYTGIQQY